MVMHRRSLDRLAQTIDIADPATGRHSRAATRMALTLAARVDPALARSPSFELGCRLHDAGKLAIPNAVLNKPGELTPAEWTLMRGHPELGAQMCMRAGAPSAAVHIVRHHHERWDGRGYPYGLAGTEIPLGARVLAVADALDAMTSPRPYREPALSRADAIERVRRGHGTQFDPLVVDALLAAGWPGLGRELAIVPSDVRPAVAACGPDTVHGR